MTRVLAAVMMMVVLGTCACCLAADDGWICLFDGKGLDGWKASENPDSFKVEDGAIVAFGPRAHLFYVGEVGNHDFQNFHFKADVMTTPGSNAGLYFHTKYQETGWPSNCLMSPSCWWAMDPRRVPCTPEPGR